MNNAQLLSLLRTILQIIGTFVIAHGSMGINAAMWEQISGAVIVVAPTIWGLFSHSDAAKIAAVAAMPGATIQVNTAIASTTLAQAAADPTQTNVVAKT